MFGPIPRPGVLSLALLSLAALGDLASASPAPLSPAAPASPAPRSDAALALARPPAERAGLRKRATYDGFTDPADDGGTMLTIVPDTYPAGLGEPLNIIIRGSSDGAVLVNSKDDGGFLNWASSLNFSGNCLGAVNSGGQSANLGDGAGVVVQLDEIRENFGDIYFGTCLETFNGGNHFRYWQQNTTQAIFMATSEEMNLAKQHDIVYNGYNLGRDDLISRAIQQTIPERNVTNTTTFSGTSTYNNYTYQNDVAYVSGLLRNSSDGINHYITVEEDGYPAIDGLVAVLTIRITGYPEGEGPSSGALRTLWLPSASALALGVLTLSLHGADLLP